MDGVIPRVAPASTSTGRMRPGSEEGGTVSFVVFRICVWGHVFLRTCFGGLGPNLNSAPKHSLNEASVTMIRDDPNKSFGLA